MALLSVSYLALLLAETLALLLAVALLLAETVISSFPLRLSIPRYTVVCISFTSFMPSCSRKVLNWDKARGFINPSAASSYVGIYPI